MGGTTKASRTGRVIKAVQKLDGDLQTSTSASAAPRNIRKSTNSEAKRRVNLVEIEDIPVETSHEGTKLF